MQTEHKRKIKVLIVEDEGIIARDIQRRLEARGYTVVGTAASGEDALRLARETSPSLALMDIVLQGELDGVQTAERLRTTQDIPVVFLTAHSDPATIDRAKATLPYGYLVKPFEERELATTIEMAIYHHQAEARIREQAALLDQASDAIMVWDLQRRIRYWNLGAERLYGWTAREALGQYAHILFSAEDLSPLTQPSAQTRECGHWQGELQHRTKTGATVTVHSRWASICDATGQVTANLVLDTDITESKKLEAQLQRAQRMETIGALAGGIAHDLNNVLAPVLMGAELLRAEPLTADTKQILTLIRSSAQRGAALVKQILSFARGVADKSVLLQLRHIGKETAQLLQDTFPKAIKIHTHFASNLFPILGNPTQLHQVLLNLCVNARDAMPQGGTLTLEAANIVLENRISPWHPEPLSGPYVLLSVADTGSGMSPEVLKKIFEPFFTTKEFGKGTGLGLSTVQGIVKGLSGFVEVSSQPEKGTTFEVYLPAAPGAGLTPSSIQPPPPPGRNEQILIVDDELALLEMSRDILTSSGYRVLTARDGIEALALYQRHKPDIHAVVTDMMMPLMDGPTTIDVLRAVNPKVKIIGITGLGSWVRRRPRRLRQTQSPGLPQQTLPPRRAAHRSPQPPGPVIPMPPAHSESDQPLRDDEAAAKLPGQAAAQRHPRGMADPKRSRIPNKILVIDDDDNFRQTTIHFLSRNGFEAIPASEGREGIGLAAERLPDLILCDLNMPGVDGYEVLATLHTDDRLADIPLIFLTGQAEPQAVRRGMNLGADDYLTKPVNLDDLLAAINIRLSRRLAQRQRQQKQIERATQTPGPLRQDPLADSFLVRTSNEKRLVKVAEIERILAYGEYSWLYWRGSARGALLRKSLKQWLAELPSEQFVRVHRRAIVNLACLERIETLSNGRMQILLRGTPEPIPVSVRLAPVLNRRLNAFHP